MYGPIYDLVTGRRDKVEEYVVDDVNDWLLENMVDRINVACDTLLDNGDVDYISAERCKDLLDLISNLPDSFVPYDFNLAIDILKEYEERAIEYCTGISIEMQGGYKRTKKEILVQKGRTIANLM